MRAQELMILTYTFMGLIVPPPPTNPSFCVEILTPKGGGYQKVGLRDMMKL